MIAALLPPAAAPTIVASAVEMKSALPSPQPARKPMIDSTSPESPASVANTTITPSPMSRVRLAPMRLEIQLVKNIAMPVMTR